MGGTPINHQFEWVFSVVNQPAIGDPIYGTPQPCIPWVNRQPRHVLLAFPRWAWLWGASWIGS